MSAMIEQILDVLKEGYQGIKVQLESGDATFEKVLDAVRVAVRKVAEDRGIGENSVWDKGTKQLGGISRDEFADLAARAIVRQDDDLLGKLLDNMKENKDDPSYIKAKYNEAVNCE